MKKSILTIGLLVGWCLPLSADMPFNRADQFSQSVLKGTQLAQDSYDSRRIQLRVSSQSSSKYSSEGLTGSSCGYHALKNGVGIARSLLDRAGCSFLTSQSEADALFGSVRSPWRIDIMKERYRKVARKIYRQQVLEHIGLLGAGSPEEFNLFMEVMQSIDPQAVYYPEVLRDSFRYTANTDAIYKAVSERIRVLIKHNSSKTYLLKSINSRAKFDAYFGGASVDFTITFDGDCYATYAPGVILERVSGANRGRWVDNEEMHYLAEAQRFTDFLGGYPELIVTTFDEDLSAYHEHPHISQEFRELTQKMASSTDDCVGVVLVYLPSCAESSSRKSLFGRFYEWVGSFMPSSNKTAKEDFEAQHCTQNNGHWITLVAAQLKGKRCYYVTDSLNANRLHNERINDVIDVLDGTMPLPEDVTRSNYVKASSSYKKFILSASVIVALCFLGYSYDNYRP